MFLFRPKRLPRIPQMNTLFYRNPLLKHCSTITAYYFVFQALRGTQKRIYLSMPYVLEVFCQPLTETDSKCESCVMPRFFWRTPEVFIQNACHFPNYPFMSSRYSTFTNAYVSIYLTSWAFHISVVARSYTDMCLHCFRVRRCKVHHAKRRQHHPTTHSCSRTSQ